MRVNVVHMSTPIQSFCWIISTLISRKRVGSAWRRRFPRRSGHCLQTARMFCSPSMWGSWAPTRQRCARSGSKNKSNCYWTRMVTFAQTLCLLRQPKSGWLQSSVPSKPGSQSPKTACARALKRRFHAQTSTLLKYKLNLVALNLNPPLYI